MADGEAGGEIVVAIWAICVPIIMMFIVLVPPYFFCVAALYMYYGNQVFTMWNDVPRILSSTEKLILYGINTPNLSVIDFYLPVIATLLLGLVVTAGLLFLFTRYIRSIFSA